jgi:DNA polymerase III epsilon subunit-like protein
VGHNIGFDIAFLEAALGGGRRIEQGKYLDTLVLVREAYPDTDLKLGDLARFFELEVEPNHRALPDAEATAALLLHIGKELPGRIDTFKHTVADAIRASKNDASYRPRRPPMA